MCRQKGNTYCSALGPDVTKWSRATPLPRPDSFKEGWEHFKEALYLEEQGDFDEARRILSTHPGLEEREWFDAHAQNAGEWRRKTLGKVVPISDSPMDPNKNFSKFLKSILERDNYRCRYCSHTLLPKNRLKSMHLTLGEDAFPLGRRNSELSGYYLVLCATLDHVVPHSLGGRTIEENLVSSCWPCNYGKMNYTLEQIGLDDPRSRSPLPLELPFEIIIGRRNVR